MRKKLFLGIVFLALVFVCMTAPIFASWISFDVTGIEYTKHNDPAGEVLTASHVALDKIVVGDTVYLTGTRNGSNINNSTVLNIDKSGASDVWQDAGSSNVYSREGIVTNASLYWYMSDGGAFVPKEPGLYRIYAINSAIGVSPIRYFYVRPSEPSQIGAAVNVKFNGTDAAYGSSFRVERYSKPKVSWELPKTALTAYVSVRYYDNDAGAWYDLSGFSGIEVLASSNQILLDMQAITATRGMGYYMVCIITGNGRGVVGANPMILLVDTVWTAKYGTASGGSMEIFVNEPSDSGIVSRKIKDGEKFVVNRPLSVTAYPHSGYYTTKIEAEKRTYSDSTTYTSTVDVLAENKNSVTGIDFHKGYGGYAKSTVDEVVIKPYFAKKSYNIVFYDNDKKTILAQKTVTYGDKYPSVNEPIRDGFKFSGWSRLSGTGAPEIYSTASVVADLGNNGTTISYYATYVEGDTLSGISAKLSRASLDIDETTQLVVTGTFVNKQTGETYAKTVIPTSVTASKKGVASIGSISSSTQITATAIGSVTLQISVKSGNATFTTEVALTVIDGMNLGNILSITIDNKGTPNVKEAALIKANQMMSSIEDLHFKGGFLNHGYLTSGGDYTPNMKTQPGTYSDTLVFYARNADNETISGGSITVSYTVKEGFTFTAEPTRITKGAPSVLTAYYTLDNGYKEEVAATYSVSKDGIVDLNENKAIGIEYGDVTIMANYKTFSATADLHVVLPEVIYLPDGKTALYTEGAGMTVVLEEYANYFDYYNVDDEKIVGDTTPGGEIVVARVYLHDRLSFNTVGVSLSFDPEQLVPMNPSMTNGTIKAKYGESGYKAQDSVTATRAQDSVYVATNMTDAGGNHLIYGCIGSASGSSGLSVGESVQVMSILFAKVSAISEMDSTVVDFYDGADKTLSKTYKTNWIDKGKAINHITGVATSDEVTIPNAFAMDYPAPAPLVTLEGIQVRADQTDLFVGETVEITAELLYSDGTTVPAEVLLGTDIGSIDGKTYTATTEGVATITAIYQGMTATLTIRVTAVKAVSIEASSDVTTLEIGESATFTAVVTYNNGTKKTVSEGLLLTATPAESVAISGNIVTAKSSGDITVTCAFEGVTANVTITVNEPEVTVIRGDVNCDGEVRMNDLVLLLAYLSSGAELSEQGMKNADVTEDGRVLMNDLVVLLTYLSTGSWK